MLTSQKKFIYYQVALTLFQKCNDYKLNNKEQDEKVHMYSMWLFARGSKPTR